MTHNATRKGVNMRTELRGDGFYVDDQLVFPAELRSYSTSPGHGGEVKTFVNLMVRGPANIQLQADTIDSISVHLPADLQSHALTH